MNKVTIINTQWNKLRLQVNMGSDPNADNNPNVLDKIMNNGDSEVFNFPNLLFYRRDSNPDLPDGTFTLWTTCFADQTITNP